MRNARWMEVAVGLFMMLVVMALVVLAFRVSGSKLSSADDNYVLTASFDNIGGLKKRAEVSMSGVSIGYVDSITLDPKSFRAVVHLEIDKSYQIPVDSSASIYTHGLLGSNYIAIVPGFESKDLKQGGALETTHSALILENLIGQLIYSVKNGKSDDAPKDIAQ